jgi:hypothetical protein
MALTSSAALGFALMLASPRGSADGGTLAELQASFTTCEPIVQRACNTAPGAKLLRITCSDPGGNHGQGGGNAEGVELRGSNAQHLFEARCVQYDNAGCLKLPTMRCSPGTLTVDGLVLTYDVQTGRLVLDVQTATAVEALWTSDPVASLPQALRWVEKLDWTLQGPAGAAGPDQTARLIAARGLLATGKLDRASAQLAGWTAASDQIARRRGEIEGAIAKERERLIPLRVVSQKTIGRLLSQPVLPPNLTPTLFWRRGRLCVGQEDTEPNPAPRLKTPIPYSDLVERQVVPKQVRCYLPGDSRWGPAEPSALPLPGPPLICEGGDYRYLYGVGCCVGSKWSEDAPDFLFSQVLAFLPDAALIDGSLESDLMGGQFDGGFGTFEERGALPVAGPALVKLFRSSAGVPGELMDGALILTHEGTVQRRGDPERTYPLLPAPEGAARWVALLPSPDQRWIAAVGAAPKLPLTLFEVAPRVDGR